MAAEPRRARSARVTRRHQRQRGVFAGHRSQQWATADGHRAGDAHLYHRAAARAATRYQRRGVWHQAQQIVGA